MISLQQWRAVIGSFIQRSFIQGSSYKPGSHKDVECNDHSHVEYNNDHCNCGTVSMGAFVILCFIVIYLLLSGDIESNPGPALYTVCPSCERKVHVQKSVCSCGYINKKKTRYGGYKKHPVGIATTTDLHSVAKACKSTSCSNREDPKKCSVDTTVLCSDSDVPTEHLMYNSQDGESTTTKCNNSLNTESSTCNSTSNSTFENSQPHEHAVSQPVGTSSKWARYSAMVNNKRRQAYKANPTLKRSKSLQYYYKNKPCVAEKYRSNPSPIKRRALDRYHCNPSPVKRRAFYRYHSNPSPIKRRALDRYHSNPSPIKRYNKNRYRANSTAINLKKRQAYTANRDRALARAKAYYEKNSFTISNKTLQAYYCNHKVNKERKRQAYKASSHRLLDRRRISRLVVNTICKKYNKMRTLLPAIASRHKSFLVKKMASKTFAGKHFAVEHLLKSCLHYRDIYQHDFVKAFHSLRNAVLASLLKTSELKCSTPNDIKNALCGESLHTTGTELFFPEICYHENAFDDAGNVLYDSFPGYKVYGKDKHGNDLATWMCSDLCKIDNPDLPNEILQIFSNIGECMPLEARRYVQQMDECSKQAAHDLSLQGHCKDCYLDPQACGSTLLFLRRLAPHYCNIRKIVNMLYNVRRIDNKLSTLDRALYRGDVCLLQHIVKEQKEIRKCHMVAGDVIDESSILDRYNSAYETFRTMYKNHAEFPCMSCNKLCYRQECRELDRCTKPIKSDAWDRLLEYLEEHPVPDDGLPTGYICHYCIEKFRAGVLPSRCILNGLLFESVPAEIAELNQYEKVLIQRAKVFQIVTKSNTVAGKRLPPNSKISKVHGSTFHLPLPLQETLKRLPKPEDALPEHGELFILLRSIPSRHKVVWQDLVDMQKVYSALHKLKEINPLYSAINLPTSASGLQLDQKISEFTTEEPDNDDYSAVTTNNKDTSKALGLDLPDREPMVKRIEEEEEATLYQNYTIQALHAPRDNEKATDLYQMLRINEPTLDSRCKILDVLCFPDLYPNGYGGMHQTRDSTLRDSDYVKTIMQSRDPRFRLNIQFLFYHFHHATIRQINGGIFHKLKIVRPQERLTAARYLEKLQNQELEGNLTSIFSRLRNSQQFWIKPRNNLNAMTLHYGPATWFLTLSPAEWAWDDLGEYLCKINPPEMAYMSTSALIAADPISASRYMENKFNAMLEFLTSTDVLGEITHYFWRREYQGRGMQHFHMQIWVKGAPIIGVSKDEEIVSYINQYITCKLPDKNLSPVLHDRVLKYQSHRCNSYCLRTKKTKAGLRKVCRFGFPRPEREGLHLRSVVESVAGRKALIPNSRLYDIPRKSNECMINDYNPAILLAWEGNMDLQFIGEKSTILNWYITKYTTKAEKSCGIAEFSELTSTKSLASRLWNVALRSLSHRECGALEASDTLLGIPLYGTDPDTVLRWVDINMVRSRKVKEHHVVTRLPNDSEDLFCNSWVDTYYPNRPSDLDNAHLYDFLAWYDRVPEQPSEDAIFYYPFFGQYLKKRQHPYIINHYRYNPQQEPEKYFYALLLLFKPWRNCDSLMGESSSYAEAFHGCRDKLPDGLKYHERLSSLHEANTEVHELIQDRQTEMKKEELSTTPPDGGPLQYVAAEAHDAMEEFVEIGCLDDKVDVNEMISKLNEDQLRVFNKIKATIETQVSSGPECNAEILRLFVSGSGGTGKSFLIKTVKAWVQSTTSKHVAIAAPTGIAAFNINGLTIHRLLMLPVEHGKTPQYRPLSDDVLKIVREKLHNVTLLIIDEISMVSNVTLLYIHLRLTEIFQTEDSKDGWFGKRNLLFLGDLLQLPPVFESPVYVPVSSESALKLTGCVGTVDLWRTLFEYDELVINMRQKEEKEFASMLSRIRLGYVTDDDIQLLEKQKLPLHDESVSGRMKEVVQILSTLPADTICLLPTRHMCEQLNAEMLKHLDGKEIHLLAVDTVDCPAYLRQKVSKKLAAYSEDSSLTAGLEKDLIIKIGCKIMLRRNIDVTLGLVNGAIGTIRSVKYSIDQVDVVESILIKFSGGNEHQLEKVNCKFQIFDKAFVIRQQFPIASAYAITVHKSQGLTLHNVVTDIGNTIFTSGQSYVAMSRVTSLSGLHLINMDPRSIKALDSAILEYTYLREKFRPTLPCLQCHKKKPKRIPDRQWCVTKSTLVIQQYSDNLPANILTSFPKKGFVNTHGYLSYANSILQCVLCCTDVRTGLSKDSDEDIVKLAKAYESNDLSPLDCMNICNKLGDPFDKHCIQDPAHFLEVLVKHYSSLTSLLKHRVVIETLCAVCNKTVTVDKEQIVTTISVPIACKSIKMDDLLKSVNEWTLYNDTLCTTCNVPLKVRKKLVDAHKLVVFKLDDLNTSTGSKVRRITSINSVPCSSIKIGDCSFRLKSSIHFALSKKAGVSYMSIVSSNGKWIHCNDQTLKTACWPKGAKDLYLVFYECFMPKQQKISKMDINESVTISHTKRKLEDPGVESAPSMKTPRTAMTPSVGISHTKRKFEEPGVESCPSMKRQRTAMTPSVDTSKISHNGFKGKGKSKAPITSHNIAFGKDLTITSVDRVFAPRTEWENYRYYPVDEEWQKQACRTLGLAFVHPFHHASGGPDVTLTSPDTRSLKCIRGDGNCLFRALCYIVTGSEEQHFQLRSSIVAHMLSIPHLLCGIGPDGLRNYLVTYQGGYATVEDYIDTTQMAVNGTWGTDFEMTVFAHLLNTVVYSYNFGQYWVACFPHGIDRRIPESVTCKSLYIYLAHSHFSVVTNVLAR